MAEMDLEARLKRLQDVLGQEVKLVDPPPQSESTQEHSADLGKDEHSHDGPMPTSQVEVPSETKDSTVAQQQPDAPQKFFHHDAGPRASTQGAFDCSSFVVGQPLDESAEFCPWNVVRSYPSHYVGRTNRPHVEPFFDNIFEDRVWDIFYLYHPEKPGQKPYRFVPTAQLQIFLDHINEKLGIALSIPGGVNSDRFFIRFGMDTPRPKYLKRVREASDFAVEQWPEIDTEEIEAFKALSDVARKDWKDKMLLADMAPTKQKRKGDKTAQKRADRLHMLNETQVLLDFKHGELSKGGNQEQDIVFVCIDVEAIERPPNPISEVGIAILDSRDMCGDVPRGPCGSECWRFFQCHHLRTMEYSGLVNYQYVQGCPDKFDFGTSTFPTRSELPHAVLSILRPYMDASRELVLVGHDAKQDIQYLASIGIDLLGMNSIIRVLDSQAIHQAWKSLDSGRGLESVLADLGIFGKNLHNAGNDAVFTLRALIGIAIEQMRQEEAELLGDEYCAELLTMGEEYM